MSLDFNLTAVRETQVFDSNITHNLNKMAQACGVYKCLWRPKENGYELAAQIIPVLQDGLHQLRENPEKFKEFEASNGWGTYRNFVEFVDQVYKACLENPDAKISVSV